MGACASAEKSRQSSNRVVLFLGLDGSGSTTMLYQLLLGRHLQTIPTLGNNHETITADGMELDCWDIGGLDKMRHLWTQYSLEADGIVFVVDSSDPGRFDLAARELNRIYARSKDDSDDDDSGGPGDHHVHEVFKKSSHTRHLPIEEVPLLIFANKQDLPDAVSVDDVAGALRVASLPCKYKKVAPCSARNLDSLKPGLKWMTDHFKRHSGAASKTSPPSSPVSQ